MHKLQFLWSKICNSCYFIVFDAAKIGVKIKANLCLKLHLFFYSKKIALYSGCRKKYFFDKELSH